MSFKITYWNEAQAPDSSVLRRRLESEGYIVSELIEEPGGVYEPHSHETDQSHWILSGKVEFEVEGKKYLLGAGDRDFLPANTEHAAAVIGDQPVRYLIGVKNS